jgi:hypothetical protein
MVAIVAVIAVATTTGLFQARQIAAVPSSGPSSSTAGGPSHSPGPTSDPNRYSDGILRTFDGQPVLRWSEALGKRDTATDDTPFLVGVWLDRPFGFFNCPKDGCHFRYVSADAGGQLVSDSIVTLRFYTGGFATGPAIMRAHVHDTRITGCQSQESCDQTIVVDDIIWTGDPYTDPWPFSAENVVAAVRSIDPGMELVPEDNANAGYGGGGPVDSIGFISASAADTVPADMQITAAYLMPSVEATQRALPDVQPGPAGALQSPAWRDDQSGSGPGYSFSIKHRWLVVANVVFSVRTASPATAADAAWLARVEAALEATR